ncbi:MAG: minor capsid protein [Eubacterium sp.]
MFNVYVKMDDADAILKKHGLQYGGPAHKFLTNELMRLSDPYVPMRNSILKNSARVTEEGDAIIYDTPYARYHWYGKLMVDPKTGKGCYVFTDNATGNVVFYSRKGVQKVLTDVDLNYHGALRGSRWVERCWIDNKDAICKSLEAFIESGGA